jgi:hypothetical protein
VQQASIADWHWLARQAPQAAPRFANEHEVPKESGFTKAMQLVATTTAATMLAAISHRIMRPD